MFDYLDQLTATRRAYVAAGAKIDQLRAELRDALDANAASRVEGPLYLHDEADELFAPTMSDGQLEALFCDPFAGDPDYQPWDDASIEADAAHIAELVECGDLCGLTVFGIPFRPLED